MEKKGFTFPRAMKLGGRGTFSEIFDRGARQAKGPLLVVVAGNQVGHARLGISIGRKVGTAPKRNRIKRLIRESFRLMQHDWPGWDIVVVVRPGEAGKLPEYQQLLSTLVAKCIQKLGKQ
jgi:ribonuclease P protein component